MKKIIALSLCAALALTGCGSSNSAEGGKNDEGTKKLILSTYGLSEDISEEEVYKPFEDEFGCKIVTETGSTNERYTKLSADSETVIDVIELSQAMTAKGIEEGLFEPIDLSKIENSKYLIGAAKKMAEAGQGVAYTSTASVSCTIRRMWDLRLRALMTFGMRDSRDGSPFRISLQPLDRLWCIWRVITKGRT